jgi:hypothetical protein
MKIILLLCFVFSGFQVAARYYEKLDPIELNKKDYRPIVRNIESSPFYERCFLRHESKSFLRRAPKGTERFTLEQCVNLEEKFHGIR